MVELLELTTGFGPPDEGDEFQDSSQQFSALSGRLASAVPDDSWQGAASHAYAGKSTALATSAQWMADLDLQLATLIHDQADCVTHIRLGFGILKDLLLGAYCIELKMILSSPSGLAAAQIFARTVSSLGMLIALGMLSALSICSYENAEHADDLVPQYGLLSKAPVKRGAGVQAKVATAAGQSRASSFETVWAGMPKTSAVAPVADGASGAADQRAALSTRRDGAVRDGAAAVGQVPPGLGPGAPTVSMPTLAEVWAWSGRAAALSGHVSPHVNLVN
ncbi:hypothetical protein A5641_04045 [Mycobacterium sp. 1554424.7]|nr:hypothetical protein A5641_04045 [Mycobacterium sp. 1554424.7]